MKNFPFLKFFIGTLLGLTLAALVAFNVLLVWVATGPRSLDRLTPYFEKALTGESDVQAKIGQTWLIWDGWQHPIDLRLKDVSLLTKDGEIFSKFPEISLGVDMLALPFGQILPTSLSVSKPIVSIKQNPDKSLGFGNASGDKEIHSSADTLTALVESLINPHSKSSLRRLRVIELLGADFSIGSDAQGVIISAPDTTLVIRKESSTQIRAVLRTSLKYADQESAIDCQLAYNKKTKRIEGLVAAGKLQVATLSQLLGGEAWLSALRVPLSGKVSFALANNGTLDAVRFMVDGGRGKIIHERLDGEIPVRSLRLSGNAVGQLSQITIDQLAIDFDGSKLAAKGKVLLTDKGPGVTGDLTMTGVDTDKAHIYWPLGLAPLTREWVTDNIRGGTIPKVAAHFDIKPGDMALRVLPQQAVDARFELKGAKIRYLPTHPEVRAVDALIKVDGLALDASITSAQAFEDTRLSNGRVFIADLNPDNPWIEVSMDADTPVSDAVTFLGLPLLEHAEHLNLDAKKASGRAVGKAKIGLYFFAKDEQGKDTPLTYEVKAVLDKVGMPGFLKRFDIASASGDLSIDEKALEFIGSGSVNETNVSKAKVRYDFAPEHGIDTVVEATADINDATFKNFGVRLPIDIKATPNVVFNASLSTGQDAAVLKRFSFKGQGMDVSGNAVLTKDGKDIDRLTLDHVEYGKTKLESLEYTAMGEGYRLRISGDALDMGSELEKKSGDFSFEHFPAMDTDVTIARFYGAYGQLLQQVKARAVCAVRCTSVNISGTVDDKPWSFAIKQEGKNRRLGAASQNAGGLFRALGITESMEGGVLSLSGGFQEVAGKSQLRGELRIHDYTLKKAPVLAKILSLASLTGFFDTLSGNGIGFQKLVAPFTLQQDVITLKEAKTYGSAMGLTADGTITYPATALKIEGTIVPSYTLNNVVGKVPLLGDILTGGEGQGVFAANYKMEGKSDDPEVSVNPLSILAPGFLRHLFDAF